MTRELQDDEVRLLVLSITLENFMCHESLKVNFTQQLTCISGTNGSGKSSILTALGIILGQRAAHFDRGPNLKTLIMSNKEYFCITLVLNNYFKFHEDFFGPTIILEKYVTHSIIRLKIMNEKKEVFSTRACDLEDILDLYSLDMKNPINFLTQDTAKKLLRSTKNEHLYNFFEKAVGIDKMTEFHNETKEKVDVMEEKLEKIEKEIKKLEKEFNEQNEKLNFRSKKQALIERQAKIKEEQQKILSEIYKLKIETVYRKVLEGRNKLREKKRLIKSINRKIESLRESERKEKEVKNELANENEEKIRNFERNIRKINNEIMNHNEQIEMKSKFLEKNIKNQNDLQEEQFLYNTQEKREERIEELEKEKHELFLALQNDSKEIEEKIFNYKKQVSYLNNLKNNKLKFFSDKMSEIIKETQRMGIIGPIANYIELKEEKWYKVASIVLKNELPDFIVKNKEQRENLNQIFRKYNVNFKILLPSKRGLENKLIEFKSNRNYKTLLDVLEIKDPLIINQLIILTNLEQIILVEDRKEAHSIMRSRPSNVICAYIPSGDRISIIENSLSDFRARQNNFYFECVNSEKLEKELSRLLIERERIENEKKSIKNQLLSLDNEIFTLKQPLKIENVEKDEELEEEVLFLKDQCEKLRNRKEELEQQIKELRNNKIGPENKTHSLAIDSERNTRTQIEDEISNLRAKFSEQKALYYKFKVQYSIDRQKGHILDNECDDIYGKLITWMKEMDYYFYDHSGFGGDTENELDEMEGQLALSDYFNKTKGIDVNGELKKAEKVKSELEREFLTLKTKIKGMEKVVDERQVEISIKKIKKELKFNKKLAEKYEKRINKLVKGIQERMKKREDMRLSLSNKISDEFKRITTRRDYEGTIIFDHLTRNLDLKMAVDETKKGSRGTLSGGERSFAGICFLLSMYDCSSCLLKCLDEFDVFMDNVNRKMAIKLLQEYTFNNKVQVIVVTPLGTKDMFCDFGEVIILENTRRNTVI